MNYVSFLLLLLLLAAASVPVAIMLNKPYDGMCAVCANTERKRNTRLNILWILMMSGAITVGGADGFERAGVSGPYGLLLALALCAIAMCLLAFIESLLLKHFKGSIWVSR